MADRAISALPTATVLTATDLFVLSQSNQAKHATWQTIIGYLTAALDGHGGIQSIELTSSSGLVDTYTITMADLSTTTFTVENGRGIASRTQYWAVSDSDTTVPSSWQTTPQVMTTVNRYLWGYAAYTMNDGSAFQTTPSVMGVYGDTGPAWYVWIRYAGQRPTSDADIGTTPDNWIGIYSGTSATAPTSYTAYTWFMYKGEKGDTGDPAAIVQQSVTYLESNSGTVVPSGSWTTNVPSVTPGNFLWTRTVLEFNTGTTVTSYSVSRYGIDGTGAVSTVNNIGPDSSGNIALPASGVPASDSQSVQAHITAAEADIDSLETIAGDGSLSGFTATDLTGAANELRAEVDTLNDWADNSRLMPQNTIPIPAEGSSVTIAMAGLTSDHRLTYWNYSASAENDPPADLSWTTGAGTCVITNDGGTITESMQPIFELPKIVPATTT